MTSKRKDMEMVTEPAMDMQSNAAMDTNTTENGGIQYGGPRIPSKTSIYIRKLPRQASYQHLTTIFSQLVPQSKIVQIRIIKKGDRKFAFVDFEDDILDQILPANETVAWPFHQDAVELQVEEAKPNKHVLYGGEKKTTAKTSIYIRALPHQATYKHLEEIFSKLIGASNIVQIRIFKTETGRKYAFVDFEDDILDTILPAHESLAWPFGEGFELKLEPAKLDEHHDEEDEKEDVLESKTKLYVRGLPQEATYQNLEDLFSQLVPHAHLAQIRIIKNELGNKYAFVDYEEDVLSEVLPENDCIQWPFTEKPVLQLEAARPQDDSNNGDGGGRTGNHTDEEGNRHHSSKTVYVGNLPPDTNEQDLIELFKTIAPTVDITRVRLKGRDKPYAFVEFHGEVVDILGDNPNKTVVCPWDTSVSLGIEAVKRQTVNGHGGRGGGNHNQSDYRDNDLDESAASIRSLYVGNLPEGTGEHNLFELCGKMFPNEKMNRVRIKGRFCFVDFDNDIQHVLNGNPKLIVNCPWDDVVDLEIEAAKGPSRGNTRGGNQHEHNSNRGGGRKGRNETPRGGGGGAPASSNPVTSLYIANIPRDTFEEDLYDLFKDLCPHQNVLAVRLNGKGKMYAHADFDGDVEHVLGGHEKLFSPCPWAENVVLELEAATPPKRGNDGGGKRAKHHHDSSGDHGDRDRNGSESYPSIYVRGLPRHTNSEHLSDLFKQLSPQVVVRRVWISKSSGPNNKYAYVRLTTKDDVENVLGGQTVKRVACLWESGAVLEMEEAKNSGR